MFLNIEKIKEFLQNSSLAENEQEEFSALLSHENDAELGPIVELFGEDPLWIKKLYDNLMRKQQAFAARDKDAWEAIMKDEEDALSTIE